MEKVVVRYLEHVKKLIKYYEQERTKGSKKYTKEELLEHLNLSGLGWLT